MNILDRISFYIFLAAVFLSPFFFLPWTSISVGFTKGIFLSIGFILAFIFWLIARLVEGKIVIPKSSILLAGFGLVVTFLLSALFSPNKGLSLFGFGFELGTWANILVAFIAMFLASIFLRDKKNTILFYCTLAASFVLTAVPGLISIFAGPQSSIARYVPTSLIGSLSDLSIYSGFISILTILALEFLPLSKMLKIFSWVVIAIAIFLMSILNFLPVWIVLGIFALFIFIYNLSLNKKTGSRFPLPSFLIVIVSLLFILSYNIFGNSISSYFNVSNIDVRPSFSTTYSIAKNTLAQDPVFGTGPNRFINSWLLYKPTLINQTQFWDTNFTFGSGLIPSFFVTTGLLGGLSLLVFMIIFAVLGFRKVLAVSADSSANFGIFSSFLLSLYLWIFSIIYVPNVMLFILAFVMTGIFAGLVAGDKKNNFYNIQFLKDPRLSFFSILVLVCFIISAVLFGYVIIKKFTSAIYFSRSASAPNTAEGLEIAEKNILRAVALDKNDLYFRSLSQIYLIKLGNLINSQQASTEESKKEIQNALSQAEESAKLAIGDDKDNYLNWLILGSVYENVLPFNVAGAYDSAKGAYNNALSLNPQNPSIYLILARLELENKNPPGAESYIKKALELKPNYTEAINALDSLQKSQ